MSTHGEYTGNRTLPDGRHRSDSEENILGDAAFTWVVIAICSAVFLFQLMIGLPDRPYLLSLGAQHFYNSFTLSRAGLAEGHAYQFVSSMFLHGNFLHILFNMMCLASVGPWVERILGRWHFLVIFLLGGIFGGLAHVMTSAGGILGASGGVFAVVMALLAYQPRARLWLLLFFIIPIRMRAQTLSRWLFAFTGLMILLGMIPGLGMLSLPMIGHEAHLGGMLLGMAYVRLFFREPVDEPFDPPAYPGEVRPGHGSAAGFGGPRTPTDFPLPPAFQPPAPRMDLAPSQRPAPGRARDIRGTDPAYEALVDKLEREGLASLTPAELRLLDRGAQR